MDYNELNSTFEYGSVTLKVVNYTKCKNCYFRKIGAKGFNCRGNVCRVSYREDKKSVMFIEQKGIEYQELNSIFEFKGKTLKVLEAIGGCSGCYFYDNNYSCSIRDKPKTSCTPFQRIDNTSIIYQEVSQLKGK